MIRVPITGKCRQVGPFSLWPFSTKRKKHGWPTLTVTSISTAEYPTIAKGPQNSRPDHPLLQKTLWSIPDRLAFFAFRLFRMTSDSR